MKSSNWQLFLDNYMLARSTGLDRVVHHPAKRGVVIPRISHGRQTGWRIRNFTASDLCSRVPESPIHIVKRVGIAYVIRFMLSELSGMEVQNL